MEEQNPKKLKVVVIEKRGHDDYYVCVANESPADATMIEWEEKDELLREVLSYLDVVSLIQLKPISKRWKDFCIYTIDHKVIRKYGSIQPFKTNRELRDTVEKYERRRRKNDAEEIATKYGWPINKWNISNLEDLSNVFHSQYSFNENISSWDTRNVKDMNGLFSNAISFNQDISSWNTSKVQNMSCMFYRATSFNQDISSWNVGAVRSMYGMFQNSSYFNQDISSWDVSNVRLMINMFYCAINFNQNISSWNPQSVVATYGMFVGADLFNKNYVSSWNLLSIDKYRMFQ